MKAAALVAVVVVGIGWSAAAQDTEQRWTGVISDSHCGASHEAMNEGGARVSDRECTMACVGYGNEGGPEYVFVIDGEVYGIANQDFPGLGPRAGRPVILTGEMVDEVITVESIDLTSARPG